MLDRCTIVKNLAELIFESTSARHKTQELIPLQENNVKSDGPVWV